MNSMSNRAERKQKIVSQGIAFIILGVASIFIWHALKNARVTGGQPTSEAILLSALSSLFNDLYLVLLISLLAILFGMAFAFYLEEWLSVTNWIRRLIESLVAILTGIPSLAYGILAILIFFSYADTLKEAIAAFPLPENIGAIPSEIQTTVFYAEALTFILIVMPVTIRTTQEALRSVGTPIREAAYALGASRWQVLTRQVVPLAFTRMLAGCCRAMARAFATAALLIGTYIWHYTTETDGMSSRFLLFLGIALFLSICSSTLVEIHTAIYGSDSA